MASDATNRTAIGRVRRFLRAETLTEKASLSALASMIDYVARLVIGFFLNPLLVSRLGDVSFGIYQVLGRFIGYATPASGRPSQALKWTLAHEQRSTDYEAKRLQVGSAIVVWFLFLPGLVVATGLLAWFAPVWLEVPPGYVWTVRAAAAVLALDLILTNLVTIPQSVLQGENLGYKRIGLSTLVLIAGGILTAVVVLLGWGIIGVAFAVVSTTLATGLTFLWVVRQNVAWFGVSWPSLRGVVPYVRLSGWFVLWNLVIQLMRSSDVVVLGLAGSAQLVTVFVLARYVPEAIFGIVAIAISAVMPGLGGLIGDGRSGPAAQVRRESMAVTWLIATTTGSVYLLWGDSFMRLWVGGQYYPGALTSFLIVGMVLQFAFIRNDAAIIDLTLDLRLKVILGLVSSAVSIGAALVAIRLFDPINGLVLGFVAGRSILSIAYPWQVCRYLGVSIRGQALGVIRPALVSAALLGGTGVGATLMEVRSWPALVAVCAASLVVSSAVAFGVGLASSTRSALLRRVKRLAPGAR